jgi:hypothetical protein
MMRVFTPDFVEKLRKKYGRLPEYNQPILYHVAINPNEAEEVRNSIERWLADIPPTPRLSILIRRLRSPRTFQEAYHELVVFHVFRSLGYDIRYEMPLSDGVNTITPDLCIVTADGTPWFAVEGFTANPSDEEKSDRERRSRFLKRLRAIPANVILDIDELPGCHPPEKLHGDQIAREIETWLASRQPGVGMETVLGEMRFTVKVVDPMAKKLQFNGPVQILKVPAIGMRRKICEKVNGYRTILTSIRVPLVVAVVPGDFVLDKSDLRTALFGQEVARPVQFGPEGATTYELATANDGMLTRDKPVDSIMSVVAWIDKVRGEWSIEPFHNPASRYPLTLRTA